MSKESIFNVGITADPIQNHNHWTSSDTKTNWSDASWSSTWYYSTPMTIYMYQLTCPRCKESSNWCQLDKSVSCKRCKATLKAVSTKADYEVPVK